MKRTHSLRPKRLFSLTMACLLALSLLCCGCGASSLDYKNSSTESATQRPMADAKTEEVGEVEVEDVFSSSMDTAEAVDSSEAAADPLADKNIKLIWTAELYVETLDYDALIEKMNLSIQGLGGYIESSYVEGGLRLASDRYTNRYGSYSVRIPSANLDAFLEQMGSIGNVTSKSKSSENITLEYADQEARKATLELEEQKLMELLEQATELEDIITLEARLSDVHYLLDGYSSTLRKYDDLVDYSTVTVHVNEVQKMTQTQAKTLGERIQSGFSDSLYELKVFGEDLLVFLLARSPILLLWAIVILAVVFLIRKLLKRRAGQPKKERRLPEPPTYSQPKTASAAEETKDASAPSDEK